MDVVGHHAPRVDGHAGRCGVASEDVDGGGGNDEVGEIEPLRRERGAALSRGCGAPRIRRWFPPAKYVATTTPSYNA